MEQRSSWEANFNNYEIPTRYETAFAIVCYLALA